MDYAAGSNVALGPESVAMGDMNADGRSDVAGATTTVASVFLGLSPTHTVVTGSPNTVTLGGAISLTAQVTASGSGVPAPTDSVRFFDGTTLLGTSRVTNGTAAMSLFVSNLGDHTITAVYKGDSHVLGSTAPSTTVRVVATANPSITKIIDVTNDQGREVRLSFARSPFDYTASATPITGYQVYRRAIVSGPSTRPNATVSVLSAPQLAGWDYVITVPATTEDAYQTTVPTFADSNASGFHRAVLFVRAATAAPGLFYDSAPDSGYSVDNLPPAPPAPFSANYADGATHLHWGTNTESDLWYYALYRGSASDFIPGPSNQVAAVSDTVYADAGTAGSWYKLAAVDINGNVSGFAVLGPGQTTDVGGAGPLVFAFAGALSNPIVGSHLQVQFVLPDATPARLEFFDVAGHRVAWRDVGALGAGRHTVELSWDKRLSGVYLMRLTRGANQLSRRITVLN